MVSFSDSLKDRGDAGFGLFSHRTWFSGSVRMEENDRQLPFTGEFLGGDAEEPTDHIQVAVDAKRRQLRGDFGIRHLGFAFPEEEFTLRFSDFDMDERGPRVPGGPPEISTHFENRSLVFRNIASILEAAGSSLDRVVRCGVFVADKDEFGAMNEVYEPYARGAPPGAQHHPTRAPPGLRLPGRDRRHRGLRLTTNLDPFTGAVGTGMPRTARPPRANSSPRAKQPSDYPHRRTDKPSVTQWSNLAVSSPRKLDWSTW